MTTDKFLTLKDEINKQWERLYGKDDVDDITKLKNRILYIAEDRNCWVWNAKEGDKEIVKLRKILDPPDVTTK